MKELPTGVQSDQAKKKIDWERIEADYRAGLLSVREIAATQGVSHVAISKRAKREGWDRDLSAKIKAKADALVTKREVTKEVTSEKAVTDQAIIEANAMAIADVRMKHRGFSTRMMKLCETMMEELETVTDNQASLSQLAETVFNSPDDDSTGGEEAQSSWQAKRLELFNRTIGVAARIDSLKKLVETGDRAVALQERIWGFATDQNKQTGLATQHTHTFEGMDKDWDEFQSAIKH